MAITSIGIRTVVSLARDGRKTPLAQPQTISGLSIARNKPYSIGTNNLIPVSPASIGSTLSDAQTIRYLTLPASYKVESKDRASGGGYIGPRVYPPPYSFSP